jgi:uncharacterized protein YbcI
MYCIGVLPKGKYIAAPRLVSCILHHPRSDDLCSVAQCRSEYDEPPIGRRGSMEVPMKTQGEIEAAVCTGVTSFEREFMGRGPKNVHAHLIGDLLVVRLQGVLTAAEQQLVQSLPAEKGRDLLKQVRTHLIETARPVLEAMILETTGVKVVSLHHDISTATGEEVVLFALAGSPLVRQTKTK